MGQLKSPASDVGKKNESTWHCCTSDGVIALQLLILCRHSKRSLSPLDVDTRLLPRCLGETWNHVSVREQLKILRKIFRLVFEVTVLRRVRTMELECEKISAHLPMLFLHFRVSRRIIRASTMMGMVHIDNVIFQHSAEELRKFLFRNIIVARYSTWTKPSFRVPWVLVALDQGGVGPVVKDDDPMGSMSSHKWFNCPSSAPMGWTVYGYSKELPFNDEYGRTSNSACRNIFQKSCTGDVAYRLEPAEKIESCWHFRNKRESYV